MVHLRCTKPLLRRLDAVTDAVPGASTTVLGDWYATRIVTRPAHLVLCVSERTLLPVLLPATPLSGLLPRFRSAVANMLVALGIGDVATARELTEMADVAVAPTANRSVLGSMNDFRRMLPFELDGSGSLQDAALRLAEAPCRPINMQSPRRVTLDLFARGRG